MVDAAKDHVSDSPRDRDPKGGCLRVFVQVSLGQEKPDGFAEEQRVAVRLPVQGRSERRRRDGRGGGLDVAGHVVLVQARQGDVSRHGSTGELREGLAQWVLGGHLDVAVDAEDEDAAFGDLADQKAQQQQRWCVGRLKVVQHQRQGRGVSRVEEECPHRIEQLEPSRFRVYRGRRREVRRQLVDLRQHPGDVGRARPHLFEDRARVLGAKVGSQ